MRKPRLSPGRTGHACARRRGSIRAAYSREAAPRDIPPDQFWRVAGHVLGLANDYLRELDTLPTFPPDVTGLEVQHAFAEPLPLEGAGEDALVALAGVLQWSRPPSPRFFGYVLGSGDPIAACADLLASVLNQNVTAWRSAPAAVTIERVVVGWLAEAIGCKGFTGSLTGGGSSVNTMGLAMAREARLPANEDGAQPAIVYASDEARKPGEDTRFRPRATATAG